MLQVQPQQFFRFAADHCGLLTELYHHSSDRAISEAQVLGIIRKASGPDSPAANYLFERMLQLGFLEAAPGADAVYEIPHSFGQLLGFLLHEYRLTSVEVIQGYLKALDRFCMELDQASQNENGEAVVRILIETDEHIERMRADSRHNRDAIIAACVEAKTNEQRLRIRQRFELINHLYEKYLKPMRDMINVEKEMDAQVGRLGRSVGLCREMFLMDRPVSGRLEATSARLLRLRRDIDTDFRESYRELTPLYEQFRRESLIARGAAMALEHISKKGIKGLELCKRIGLGVWQTQSLVSNVSLEACIHRICNYKPQRVRIDFGEIAEQKTEYIDTEDFAERLGENQPIDDVLAWVIGEFPDVPLGQVLKVYGMVHGGQFGKVNFGTEMRQYHRPGCILKAWPMRLEITEKQLPMRGALI